MAERPLRRSDRESGLDDPQVSHVLESLQASIDAHDLPEGFSDKGLARLLDRQTEYLEDLGQEAVRLARVARINEVQPVHIDQAEAILRVDPGRRKHGYEAAGGLLWGLSSSAIVQELASSKPKMWLIGLAAVVLVLATGILVWAIASDQRPRP